MEGGTAHPRAQPSGGAYLVLMVEVHLRDGSVDIEVRGLHKLWALKRRLRVPVSSIKNVRRVPPRSLSLLWKGWRAPGTHVPGVITAGTFYKRGERHFWDVRDPRRAIEIELHDAEYDRIFVEVDDPEYAVHLVAHARELSADPLHNRKR